MSSALKKRKIAVLGSRSVGECRDVVVALIHDEPLYLHCIIFCLSL